MGTDMYQVENKLRTQLLGIKLPEYVDTVTWHQQNHSLQDLLLKNYSGPLRK